MRRPTRADTAADQPSDQAPRLETPRKDLAYRVATLTWPRRALLLIIGVMFWQSAWHTFLLDDYRNLRLLEAYSTGQRDHLGLYRFLTNTAELQAERAHGYLPWWVDDDLRFSYFRPVTEAFLYAEYRLFGRSALGYRAAGLALYALGCWAALALYRAWCGEELLARWAALLFTVATCNGVPVVFIAAQCDLLAMLLSLTTLLCLTRFSQGRGVAWLACGALAYAAALMSKEAAVPVCVLPIGYALVRWSATPLDQRRGLMRRAALATGVCVAMALVLVAYHSSRGFGSNGELLLNPIREPLEYLKRMPLHVALLLISVVIPVNPLVTYLNGADSIWTIVYLVLGGAALVAVGRRVWRDCGRDVRVRVFGLWGLVFLPLLACTNPDNRVMMIPTIGWSVVAATWLLSRRATDGHPPLTPPEYRGGEAAAASFAVQKAPKILFLFIPFVANTSIVSTLGRIQSMQAGALQEVVAQFERPTGPRDCMFILNSVWQFDMLWCQDQLEFLMGRDSPRVAYLGHVMHVRPEVVDDHTLRLTAETQPFFSTFLSRMGVTRAGVRPGAVFTTDEYDAKVITDDAGALRTVEFHFRDRLDSDRYRFFTVDWQGYVTPWKPPAKASN